MTHSGHSAVDKSARDGQARVTPVDAPIDSLPAPDSTTDDPFPSPESEGTANGQTPSEDASEVPRDKRQEPPPSSPIASVSVKTPPAFRDRVFADASHFSDMGNARVFAQLHEKTARYIGDADSWIVWDGSRWRPALDSEVLHLAKIVPAYRRSAALQLSSRKSKSNSSPRDVALEFAKKCESVRSLNACIDLARSEPEMQCRLRDLDKHKHLIVVKNGVVDLRTGALQPARRDLMLTKYIPLDYIPDAPYPKWKQLLRDIFLDDDDLIAYVQRAFGYALTGETREQKYFTLFNSGGNGKSTLLRIITAAISEYAVTVPIESLLEHRRDGGAATPELAKLRGVRLVTASEPNQGARLNESLVKSLTGCDPISCRDLYKPPVTFEPEFKLMIACNHRPVIRGTDHGIRRRAQLIPFDAEFKDVLLPTHDPKRVKLRKKDVQDDILREELPGVLAWIIRGALEWYEEGLGTAGRVTAATDEYLQDSDSVGRFLDECTVKDGTRWVFVSKLFESYRSWAQGNGEPILTENALGRELTQRGFERGKEGGSRVYRGLDIREAPHEAP